MEMFKRIRKWWKNSFWTGNRRDPDFMDINPEQASLKKVVYWRLISTFISVFIGYYYLKEFAASVEMTIVEACILTAIHYVFEELWSKRYK